MFNFSEGENDTICQTVVRGVGQKSDGGAVHAATSSGARSTLPPAQRLGQSAMARRPYVGSTLLPSSSERGSDERIQRQWQHLNGLGGPCG